MSEMSDLDDAKHDIISSYKGGAQALAPLIGMKSPTVLNNKCNPHNTTHHLTVDEAVALQAITKNSGILHAMANVLGFVCVPLPQEDLAKVDDLEVLDCWAAWQEDVGTTAKVLRNALKDRRITGAELRDLKREIYQDIARELELLKRLEAIVERA